MTRTANHRQAFCTLAALGLLVASSHTFAAELLVTKGDANKAGGARVALDIVSEGDVSGFNFTVNLGKGGAASADLSKCTSGLPKGFTGECRLTNGKVVVFAMADRMTTLPAGVTSVGTIGFSAADMSKAQRVVTIEAMEFVDVKGIPLSSNTTVE